MLVIGMASLKLPVTFKFSRKWLVSELEMQKPLSQLRLTLILCCWQILWGSSLGRSPVAVAAANAGSLYGQQQLGFGGCHGESGCLLRRTKVSLKLLGVLGGLEKISFGF